MYSINILLNGKLIIMNINLKELVRTLNNYAVVYQESPDEEYYKLIYNVEVKDFCGEKVIVLQHF